MITQVDKDGSGTTFVSKGVAHIMLAERFVYGPIL